MTNCNECTQKEVINSLRIDIEVAKTNISSVKEDIKDIRGDISDIKDSVKQTEKNVSDSVNKLIYWILGVGGSLVVGIILMLLKG